MITQTGGGCRATNYIAFLRKALKEAGYPNVPVISLNVSGLEGNPGFKITPKLVDGLLKACTWGDLLLAVTLRIRPYEVNEGETNAFATQYFFHYKEEAGTCEVSPPGL